MLRQKVLCAHQIHCPFVLSRDVVWLHFPASSLVNCVHVTSGLASGKQEEVMPATSRSAPPRKFPWWTSILSLSPSVKVEARYFTNLEMENVKKEWKKGRQMGSWSSEFLLMKSHLGELPNQVGLLHQQDINCYGVESLTFGAICYSSWCYTSWSR